MEIVKSPHSYKIADREAVFLAGTIDNGDSVDWQLEVTEALSEKDVLILNPRRDAWDSSWKQSIDNPQFKEQVEWELDGLEAASIIFLYFAPGSKSPISLLEFGLHVRDKKVIVVCPDGFWRKGNIEVVCNRYGLAIHDDLTSGISALLSELP